MTHGLCSTFAPAYVSHLSPECISKCCCPCTIPSGSSMICSKSPFWLWTFWYHDHPSSILSWRPLEKSMAGWFETRHGHVMRRAEPRVRVEAWTVFHRSLSMHKNSHIASRLYLASWSPIWAWLRSTSSCDTACLPLLAHGMACGLDERSMLQEPGKACLVITMPSYNIAAVKEKTELALQKSTFPAVLGR